MSPRTFSLCVDRTLFADELVRVHSRFKLSRTQAHSEMAHQRLPSTPGFARDISEDVAGNGPVSNHARPPNRGMQPIENGVVRAIYADISSPLVAASKSQLLGAIENMKASLERQ